MSEKLIVGENGYDSFKRNYNKTAILSEVLKGNKVVLIDDGEEYKSLCENLGIEYNKIEQIN